jgi:hypothetical protein
MFITISKNHKKMLIAISIFSIKGSSIDYDEPLGLKVCSDFKRDEILRLAAVKTGLYIIMCKCR